jgi:asparagine synthase (glutamine-hydrolysing)
VCGICGIVSLDGTPVDPSPLAAMNAALRHRGPDGEGRLVEGPVALAMRRLSIIDLEGGAQPISNEDGAVHVIQNGEIYNYRALRARLEAAGHKFSTHSDTEVLVHQYEQDGERFVDALRGMFAVAVWDARNRRLILARDRFGIKPLYYRVEGATLYFASELKALPAAEVDPDALEAFLAFNSIPAPMTIYRGTYKLPAGHLLVWNQPASGVADPVIARFARPAPANARDLRRESETELAEELRERLRNSVAAHMVADVDVGVLLSGGIDSSALTALAAQNGGRVRTFSIGFEERSFDELEVARQVARRYGTDHHELVVRPDAARLLPTLAEVFDEPFADSSALPTYLVSELAAGEVKVVLSGEGGDELFGGYYTYVADLLAPRLGWLAGVVGPVAERLPTSTKAASFDYKAKRFVRGVRMAPLERHHAWKEIFSPQMRDTLMGSCRGRTDPLDLYRARYAETTGAPNLARLQDVDLGIYLVDDLLVKTDRASMAHSLEARVPFLDPTVAELALSIPTSAKVRGLSKKRLLRRAVGPLLPRAVVQGKKRGFSIPAAAWLRGELEPFARDVLSTETLTRQGYFRPAAVAALIDDHVSGRADLSRQVWCLLAFTLWHDVAATRNAVAA